MRRELFKCVCVSIIRLRQCLVFSAVSDSGGALWHRAMRYQAVILVLFARENVKHLRASVFLSFWFTSIMMAYASTHSLFSSLSSLSSRCFLTCMSDWIQSSTCSFVAAGRKRCVNKWRQHLFQPVRRADLWRRSWQKMEGFDKQTSLLCDRNEAFSVTQSSNYGSVSFFFLITWPAANTALVCAPRVHRADQCSENKHRLTF